VRSKVRCSLHPGGCSRCATKNISCTYQSTLKGKNPTTLSLENDGDSFIHTDSLQSPIISFEEIQDTAPNPLNDFQFGINHPSVETEEESEANNLPITSALRQNATFNLDEWSCMAELTAELDSADPLNPQIDISRISGGLQSTLSTITTPQQRLQLSPSIPISINYQEPSLLFERRRFLDPELELTGDLVLHILRSYPYMMASTGSVPPFIHPRYQYFTQSSTMRPSPLYAALRLAKMLLHGRRMNKSLIWGLIRMEQDRLFNEVWISSVKLLLGIASD
jgi:hypothetical protein